MIQKCVGGLYLCFRVILRVNTRKNNRLINNKIVQLLNLSVY